VAVNGQHLVALVRAGATFMKGVLVERPTEATQQNQEKAVACQLRTPIHNS
jgi:hypothetical protein